MKRWKVLLVLFLVVNTVLAQSQRDIYNASVKAYEGKDYTTFLRLTKTLDSLRPYHPTYTYNLASASALTDNSEDAILALRKLVLMNNAAEFENDEDFKSMRQDQAFHDVIALKKSQNDIVQTSKLVVTLSEKELHPESVAYLPKAKIWLASSIRKKKVVSFDIATGKCTDWLKDDSRLSVLAMKADSKEEFLWIATAAFPEMEGFDKVFNGKAEVVKVAVKTQKIVKRFSMEGTHVFGDLVIARNGVVYVSDSDKPIIFKIENDVMSEYLSFADDGFNLQGITLNETQDRLFVADYLKGIAMIDIRSSAKTWLEFPIDASPKGIDGLVFYKNNLIAVQNGVKPIRITKLRLNETQDGISSFKMLDNNRPEFNEPALASIVDGKLYFFANSPWAAYDKGVLDATKVTHPMLYSCPLD